LNLEEQKKLLETVLNKKIKNPANSLKRLPHSKLIDLFIRFNILTVEEEKNFFLQFRDNKDPIFYLFKIQKKFIDDLDKIIEKIENFIQKSALGSDNKFIEKDRIIEIKNSSPYKYKGFELFESKVDHEKEIIDFSFEYFEKLNYLKKNYVPSFVYNLRSGFFWLDRINQLIIIKCHDINIVNAVISALSKIFNSEYYKFNLQQSIVDKILSKKDIVKNVLKADKFKNPDLIESLIVRDKDYAEKSRDPKYNVLSEYERKAGSYLTNIKGFSKKIKVNVIESGKVSLTGKSIKLDKCREWLIDVILKIINIQENLLKDGDIENYIKSSDIVQRSQLYKRIKNQKARKKISELINKINKYTLQDARAVLAGHTHAFLWKKAVVRATIWNMLYRPVAGFFAIYFNTNGIEVTFRRIYPSNIECSIKWGRSHYFIYIG